MGILTDSTGFSSSTPHVRFVGNELALSRLFSEDLPEFLLVPSSHHYSTIVYPEMCDSANQVLLFYSILLESSAK